jgi:phage repressor protein C with HTH and peptisase S24 domain
MDFDVTSGWDTGLGMTPSDKIRAILDLDGWKQERLADELGVGQSTIHRWLHAASEPRGQHRDAIAALYIRVFRPDEGEPEKTVKLAGYVGAAQAVYQFDDGAADYVEAPPGAGDMTEAVEVRGDSMLPLYETGTLLYYSKQLPPDAMIGRRAVVRVADGRVLVKSVRRGSAPGFYTLVSLNAPDIEDVVLEWAAPIDWIKPR